VNARGAQVEQLYAELRSISRSGERQVVELELQRILESDQFRTSSRSCRFLRHVIGKAFAGEPETLKERVLGIELFDRSSTFDTDRDSVVRVAANDVRKRLREYYRHHPDSRVRIDLPSGLYVPEIEVRSEPLPGPLPEPPVQPPIPIPDPQPVSATFPLRRWHLGVVAGVIAAVSLMSFWSGGHTVASRLAFRTPPWSTLLQPGGVIDIVPADANLVIAKIRSHQDVPLQAYNDHSIHYAGDFTGALKGYINQIPLTTVSDANIASRISDLAARAGVRAQVKACNRVGFSELKGDVPVVLLGSPTSNPWVQLVYDRLNFQVVHRFEDGFDICVNRRPKSGEQATYVPALKPQGFSEGYAIVALLPNLTGTAPVLVIAGTNTEGTEAAGEFVSNLDRLSESLHKLKIGERGPVRHLELLIKTSFVSSASAAYEILAYRTE
jgi:hypothetical protein